MVSTLLTNSERDLSPESALIHMADVANLSALLLAHLGPAARSADYQTACNLAANLLANILALFVGITPAKPPHLGMPAQRRAPLPHGLALDFRVVPVLAGRKELAHPNVAMDTSHKPQKAPAVLRQLLLGSNKCCLGAESFSDRHLDNWQPRIQR